MVEVEPAGTIMIEFIFKVTKKRNKLFEITVVSILLNYML